MTGIPDPMNITYFFYNFLKCVYNILIIIKGKILEKIFFLIYDSKKIRGHLIKSLSRKNDQVKSSCITKKISINI